MAAVLVTSKKKAIVVPGSTPPKNQELVPLHITYCILKRSNLVVKSSNNTVNSRKNRLF